VKKKEKKIFEAGRYLPKKEIPRAPCGK